MYRKGLVVVISGPAGVGKGTVIKQVKARMDNLIYSVSATTRKPRCGEIEGTNYFFKSVEEFESMIENDELLEWVKYVDNYYGTPRSFVEDCVDKGIDIIVEIEVEGAMMIKHKYPECLMIFVLPPSFDELVNRISGRGTESMEVIDKRMIKAKAELKQVYNYDYGVVNGLVEQAAEDVCSIIRAERLKTKRLMHIFE